MLVELCIRNFAIIDELHVSFGEGLNVISGETGAGKSIIIGAISLLLGDRAVTDMIRSSADTATIEASFNISGMDFLKTKLREMDFDSDDELIIKRTISRSGKNKVHINGNLANLAILSSISEPLVNICGQHEHQVILNRENHIDMIDGFGGLKVTRQEYEELYGKYQSLREKLRELERQRTANSENEEIQRFHLKEIIDADVKKGEDESLLDEKKLITHAQKLIEYVNCAYDKLYGSQGSVLEELRHVLGNIREINKIDQRAAFKEKDIENNYYQLEDIALTLRNYGKSLFFDPRRLDIVEERLEVLGRLKRRYGGTLEAVLNKKTDLESSLKNISSITDEIAQTVKIMEETTLELKEKAFFLSQRRRETATNLQSEIEAEIHTLKMEKAVFTVQFAGTDRQKENMFNGKGIDDVEFFISTNAGEELKPLIHIASGGELSRIILAMKKVLAGISPVGTIIFDEVDSGIGGATAAIVGEKLKDVAENYQILCITHLPQIACFAKQHYRVFKEETDVWTQASIRVLTEDERIDEITRMLAGVELTEKARDHAREMLDSSRALR
jgi:DNA repair protein RecN (Recombination protein N)